MSSRFLAFFFFLGAISMQAQKMPVDYFNEGIDSAQNGNYISAAASFRYIVANHPHNELYPEAFYNLGLMYKKGGNTDRALFIFHAVLQSDLDDRMEIGGDIMSDPYANFKHNASELISDIYYDKQQYDSALYYFKLSDTVYPYQHFCGNEIAQNKLYTALRYADIYDKMKKPGEAIKVLLPLVFENELADNSAVLDSLKALLTREKIAQPQKQLDDALGKMYPKKVHFRKHTYTFYYFTYLGAEIQVPGDYGGTGKKFDKEAAANKVRKTAFYKMISELEQ